jgi:hypothetical protein
MPSDSGSKIRIRRFLTLIFIVVLVGCGSLVQANIKPERQISQGSDDAEEDVIPSTIINN